MDSTKKVSETVEIPIIIEKTEQQRTMSQILQLVNMDSFTDLGILADTSFQKDDSSANEEVTFVVQESEFTLSKDVLKAKSALFAELFIQKPSSRYILTKVKPKVFSTVFEFIKTSKISSELSEDAAEILETAHKLEISSLKDISEDYLANNLSNDNATSVLLLADQTNCRQLKLAVMQFIAKHCPNLVDSNEFQRIVQHRPKLGLELFKFVQNCLQ